MITYSHWKHVGQTLCHVHYSHCILPTLFGRFSHCRRLHASLGKTTEELFSRWFLIRCRRLLSSALLIADQLSSGQKTVPRESSEQLRPAAEWVKQHKHTVENVRFSSKILDLQRKIIISFLYFREFHEFLNSWFFVNFLITNFVYFTNYFQIGWLLWILQIFRVLWILWISRIFQNIFLCKIAWIEKCGFFGSKLFWLSVYRLLQLQLAAALYICHFLCELKCTVGEKSHFTT